MLLSGALIFAILGLSLGSPILPASHAISHTLSSRGVKCPYDSRQKRAITIPDRITGAVHSVAIQYLGVTLGDCVYQVVAAKAEGQPPIRLPALARTIRSDFPQTHYFPTDISVLEGVNALMIHGRGNDGLEWIVVKRPSGKYISETTAWKQMFPKGYNTDMSEAGFLKCFEFVIKIHKLVRDKLEEYVTKYSWNLADIDYNNMLFADDLSEVTIIDWSMSMLARNTPEGLEQLRHQWNAMLLSSEITMMDKMDHKKVIQGICYSYTRETGVPFEDPLPPPSMSWVSTDAV